MNKEPKQDNSSLKYHLQNRRLKKKIKQLEAQSKQKKTSGSRKMKVILFILAASFSVYLYYELGDIVFLNEKVRFYEITKQLRTNVFHQQQAVELIIGNLERMREQQWRAEMFVIPFIGTTGVSKTYVANIIKQNYYPTYVHDVSKYDLVLNFEQTYYDILKNVQDCCNLIIIDDLTHNDVNLTVRFLASLPKHKIALVIPIINIQAETNVVNKSETQFSVYEKTVQDIEKKLIAAGLQFDAIFFHVLDKYQLETAIIQLMIQRSVDYDKCGHLVKDIVENHDVTAQGYKQLHNKLHIIWDCGLENIYTNSAFEELKKREI